MKNTTTPNKTKEVIFVFVTIVAALSLQKISILCGLQKTFDSNLYIEMAKEITEKGFFTAINTEGFNTKPPFFPLLISIFSEKGMAYFTSICFVSSLCISWLTINKIFSDFVVKVLCFAFLAFGTPLILVHSFLWTEPFFITIIVTHVYLLYHYINTNRKKYLIIVIACSILLTLIRHAGIFIILGTVIGLLVTGNSKKEYFITFFYGFFSSSTFIAWNLFKMKGLSKRYDDLLVPVTENRFSIYQENIINYLDQMPNWILPPVLPSFLEIIIFVLLIVTAGIVFWKFSEERHHKFLSAMAILLIVYYGCMHTMYTVDPSDIERYLSPIFPVFTIILFKAVDLSIPKLTKNIQPKYVYAFFSFLFLLYPILRTIKNVLFFYQSSCSS